MSGSIPFKPVCINPEMGGIPSCSERCGQLTRSRKAIRETIQRRIPKNASAADIRRAVMAVAQEQNPGADFRENCTPDAKVKS